MAMSVLMLWDIVTVKIQPLCNQQSPLQGDAAEEEASLARLVSSHTLPHQNIYKHVEVW